MFLVNNDYCSEKYILLHLQDFKVYHWVSLVAQLVMDLPAMWESWIRSLGWEDLLEKGNGPKGKGTKRD